MFQTIKDTRVINLTIKLIKVNINNNGGRVTVIMGNFHAKESKLIFHACLSPAFCLLWLQMQSKFAKLQNFAIFTGKFLCWPKACNFSKDPSVMVHAKTTKTNFHANYLIRYFIIIVT